MKTILFVSHSAELNGAELWLLETLRGLDRGAYLPRLVVPRPGPLANAARAAGVETRVVPMKWSITEKSRIWRQPFAAVLNAPNVARLGRIIRRERIDLVFTNSSAVACGARAARRAGVPHVWAIHEVLGGDEPFLRSLRGARALTDFIAAVSAKVIVNSRLTGSAFRDQAKIALVPNGLELAAGDSARRDYLRAEIGLGEGDFAAGIIGKIYDGKGQKEAIQAAALLAARHPGFKLLVIGDVEDGAYARRLRALVAANGLERRVLFLGYRPDLAAVLKILNAVVVASVVESFGRTALEGMAAGVPVLAVRAGGLAEIIRPGDNGFLVDSRAPEEIAHGLEFIIGNPAAVAAAVEGGYRTIREEYSLDKQIRGVERVLADVLGAA
jgi:glycosyltransferase involved in cell wall biosynthesis